MISLPSEWSIGRSGMEKNILKFELRHLFFYVCAEKSSPIDP